MRPPAKVAFVVDGIREVQAGSGDGDYPTLCGFDTDEQEYLSVNRRERIDCPACLSIWKQARTYRASDFDGFAERSTRSEKLAPRPRKSKACPYCRGPRHGGDCATI